MWSTVSIVMSSSIGGNDLCGTEEVKLPVFVWLFSSLTRAVSSPVRQSMVKSQKMCVYLTCMVGWVAPDERVQRVSGMTDGFTGFRLLQSEK